MIVNVLGQGYIGLPTAIALAKAGNDVRGFDTNQIIVNRLQKGEVHIKEDGLQESFSQVVREGSLTICEELQKSDVYIITVPTPFKEDKKKRNADLSFVVDAAKNISRMLKKDDLVILESTVPPGTTRMITDLLSKESGLAREAFDTAYCPERVLPGKMMYEMTHNDRIIGSERREAAVKAKKLYDTFLQDGRAFITDDVTAEMCKLVENSFRDVNIAFANELSIICDELNIDVNELISLANKHPRVNLLSPGVGVGGHCISVDPWFIVEAFEQKSKLITAARNVNDQKPIYLAEKIAKMLNFNENKRVAVLGLSYKPDVDDFRESPSLIMANQLASEGYKVMGCDPNCTVPEIEGIKIFSFDQVCCEADLIVVAQNHREFIENKEKLKQKECIYL
ncbi:MAG: nucleotide sugar dehydrogenase [Clostridiales bacterium]|nr:nucleotide sugar dehydrogenase [Clostridiales bacterium]